MKTGILVFVVGLVVGVAAGVLVPRLLAPHLPEAFRSDEGAIEGVVVAKLRRDPQLLLTVDTTEGAVLATFNNKVEEISLLVGEGDTVDLGLRRYEPFAEDPPIRRVVKKRPAPEAAPEGEAMPQSPAAFSEPAPEPMEGASGDDEPESPVPPATSDPAEPSEHRPPPGF